MPQAAFKEKKRKGSKMKSPKKTSYSNKKKSRGKY